MKLYSAQKPQRKQRRYRSHLCEMLALASKKCGRQICFFCALCAGFYIIRFDSSRSRVQIVARNRALWRNALVLIALGRHPKAGLPFGECA